MLSLSLSTSHRHQDDDTYFLPKLTFSHWPGIQVQGGFIAGGLDYLSWSQNCWNFFRIVGRLQRYCEQLPHQNFHLTKYSTFVIHWLLLQNVCSSFAFAYSQPAVFIHMLLAKLIRLKSIGLWKNNNWRWDRRDDDEKKKKSDLLIKLFHT